jgi:hypothetical protein
MSDPSRAGGPMPERPETAGERLADDLAAVVRAEVSRARGELSEAARRAGTGGLLLGAAGICALLGVGAASTTVLRIFEVVLPRRLASAGLAAGYLTASAVLAVAGLDRLRAAGGSSEHLAEDAKEMMSGVTERLSSTGAGA